MGKIRFEPVGYVPDDVVSAYRAYSRSLGLPEIIPGRAGAAVAPHLAVVGGSPTVVNYIDNLREWDGDIVAVNGAWEWCRDSGIDAIFYTIDSSVFAPDGVHQAILGDTCRPELFDALWGAETEIVMLGDGGVPLSTTSAGTVPSWACWRGHKTVTFFGCESSFGARTHAYKEESHLLNKVWVMCGQEYETCPQMIMQAEVLAEMARTFPGYINVEGEGFLPALIEHGDYTVTHVSPKLAEQIGIAA